jgi:hypothetical protein
MPKWNGMALMGIDVRGKLAPFWTELVPRLLLYLIIKLSLA